MCDAGKFGDDPSSRSCTTKTTRRNMKGKKIGNKHENFFSDQLTSYLFLDLSNKKMHDKCRLCWRVPVVGWWVVVVVNQI